MAVDFTEKAKRYQAIDEIIASGRKLKWNQIISELSEKYNIKTSRTSFFRDIQELIEKYGAPIDTDFETNGYYYNDPQYRLPRFYTDENAAKAAKLLKTLLSMVKTIQCTKKQKKFLNLFLLKIMIWHLKIKFFIKCWISGQMKKITTSLKCGTNLKLFFL